MLCKKCGSQTHIYRNIETCHNCKIMTKAIGIEGLTIKIFENLLSVRFQAKEFALLMTYCKYRAPFYDVYIKHLVEPEINDSYIASKREYTIKNDIRYYPVKSGSLCHAIEKKKEMETGKIEMPTKKELRQTLPDTKKDIELPRDDIYSRLSFIKKTYRGDMEVILTGRPDKILRKSEYLIIEEDKSSNDPFNYVKNKDLFLPFILQTLVYANSRLSIFRPVTKKVGKCDSSQYINQLDIFQAWDNNPGSIIINDYDRGNEEFFDIPCKKKILKINIKDSRFIQNIEDNIAVKIEIEYNKEIENYLRLNLLNFMNLILRTIDGNHPDKFRECSRCRRITCQIRELRYNLHDPMTI